MALKPDRTHLDSYIDFFMNEATCIKSSTKAERGGIVCVSTVGSGIAMDQAEQLCTYSADPRASGVRPLGVLMNDMVNLDLTRQHINWHKDEVQKGGKVTIWAKGWVVTDWIYPGTTPAAGNPAYVANSGYIAPSDICSGSDNGPDSSIRRRVGTFLSSKDEDGYAKVAINLP